MENEELVVKEYNIASEMPSCPEVCDSNSGIAREIKSKANFTEEQYQSFLDQLRVIQHEDEDEDDYYEGVKLGGWIFWCPEQAEYLDCPDCGVRMDITFLEMDDGDLYQFLFRSGDFWGQVNVTLCPQCVALGML